VKLFPSDSFALTVSRLSDFEEYADNNTFGSVFFVSIEILPDCCLSTEVACVAVFMLILLFNSPDEDDFTGELVSFEIFCFADIAIDANFCCNSLLDKPVTSLVFSGFSCFKLVKRSS